MDVYSLMREQELDDLAHCSDSFENGEFEMAQFVRIETRVFNLANIASVAYSAHGGASGTLKGIEVHFVGSDSYTVVYESDPGYRDLYDCMERQPSISDVE